MTSITLVSGKMFDPVNPDPAHIQIEEIAHALAHICRFTGHTRSGPLTVAQHSVEVSLSCPEELALTGLLHDATEAYLNDVAAPLKHLPMFREYVAVEERLWGVIALRFGLPTDIHPIVHRIDREAAWKERERFVLYHERPWSHIKAREQFMQRFRSLYEARA